jgi:hypothetical protein
MSQSTAPRQYCRDMDEPFIETQRDECVRCGYDLRGIVNERPCPECGLLAERSRRVTDELHDTRPRWLRRISIGVWTILLAIVLAVASPLVAGLLVPFRDPRFFWAYAAPLVGAVVAALVFLIGVYLLTSREGYAPADTADRRRRYWLRAAAAIPLALLLLEHAANEVNRQRLLIYWNGQGPFRPSPYWIVRLLQAPLAVPLPILLFYQLRSLAKRARSAHLAEHCLIVGFGAAGALLYIALVAAFFELVDLFHLGTYWTSRSAISLMLMLLTTVAAALFLLWSIYLLVRFGIAFHKAARQLKRKWRRDDRSLVPDAAQVK